jgi:hypothetical protein
MSARIIHAWIFGLQGEISGLMVSATGVGEKKTLCSHAAIQHVCSPSQFLSSVTFYISQFFKTYLILRKKVSSNLKTVRECKHVDLQQGCIEFG